MNTQEFRSRERALVRSILTHRNTLSVAAFSVQGFGFMRFRVNPNMRIHIWHSALRIPGVSDIHDHAQWSFRSRIMSGQLVNIRFHEVEGNRYHCGLIKCGEGGGMGHQLPTAIDLTPDRPEIYEADEHGEYYQKADEIHRTYAADGTVTLITQDRSDVDTARVYWPHGTPWVDAVPRQATHKEIDEIGAYALNCWTGSA